MFIVKFQGGLGNQLFQYAAGFSSSIRRKTTMKMDLTGYGVLGRDLTSTNNSGRDPDILEFSISAGVATAEEAAAARAIPFGLIGRKLRAAKYKYVVDYYIGYRGGILSPERGGYMDGYFQDETYFVDKWPEVSRELQLRPDRVQAMKSTVNALAEVDHPTVSLHVRRGDYVASDRGRSILDVCGADYYQRALNEVSASVSDFTLVLFSDEPEWVRRNIDLGGRPAVYASEYRNEDGSPLSAAQEMFAMSRCSHHIIANSTFSWWGAYLNSDANKVVVAPSVWARGAKSFGKILPKSWRTVAV